MARHIDISLDGLHQLLYRIERKELADGDWAIYAALVIQLIAREQGKQDRMAAKLKGAANLSSGAVVEGQLVQPDAPALPAGQPASGPAAPMRVMTRRGRR